MSNPAQQLNPPCPKCRCKSTTRRGKRRNRLRTLQLSLAPSGVDHAFPSVAAGAAGDIRIAWMDQRNEPHWNVYYRTSANGGSSWSNETVLSTYVAGYSYIFTDGFRFPF